MGAFFAKVFAKLFGQKSVRILMLGLDNAGKTTILSVGFNVETVSYKNISFVMWDLGGQVAIRPYWRCYYANTNAIIYVVDSTDSERMGVSKQELTAMLGEEELAGVPIVVFANKQDLSNAQTAAEITQKLGLTGIRDRPWQLFLTSAVTGQGLHDGLEWLSTVIDSRSGSASAASPAAGPSHASSPTPSPQIK